MDENYGLKEVVRDTLGALALGVMAYYATVFMFCM